jgi:hypothetical protein
MPGTVQWGAGQVRPTVARFHSFFRARQMPTKIDDMLKKFASKVEAHPVITFFILLVISLGTLFLVLVGLLQNHIAPLEPLSVGMQAVIGTAVVGASAFVAVVIAFAALKTAKENNNTGVQTRKDYHINESRRSIEQVESDFISLSSALSRLNAQSTASQDSCMQLMATISNAEEGKPEKYIIGERDINENVVPPLRDAIFDACNAVTAIAQNPDSYALLKRQMTVLHEKGELVANAIAKQFKLRYSDDQRFIDYGRLLDAKDNELTNSSSKEEHDQAVALATNRLVNDSVEVLRIQSARLKASDLICRLIAWSIRDVFSYFSEDKTKQKTFDDYYNSRFGWTIGLVLADRPPDWFLGFVGRALYAPEGERTTAKWDVRKSGTQRSSMAMACVILADIQKLLPDRSDVKEYFQQSARDKNSPLSDVDLTNLIDGLHYPERTLPTIAVSFQDQIREEALQESHETEWVYFPRDLEIVKLRNYLVNGEYVKFKKELRKNVYIPAKQRMDTQRDDFSLEESEENVDVACRIFRGVGDANEAEWFLRRARLVLFQHNARETTSPVPDVSHLLGKVIEICRGQKDLSAPNMAGFRFQGPKERPIVRLLSTELFLFANLSRQGREEEAVSNWNKALVDFTSRNQEIDWLLVLSQWIENEVSILLPIFSCEGTDQLEVSLEEVSAGDGFLPGVLENVSGFVLTKNPKALLGIEASLPQSGDLRFCPTQVLAAFKSFSINPLLEYKNAGKHGRIEATNWVNDFMERNGV